MPNMRYEISSAKYRNAIQVPGDAGRPASDNLHLPTTNGRNHFQIFSDCHQNNFKIFSDCHQNNFQIVSDHNQNVFK